MDARLLRGPVQRDAGGCTADAVPTCALPGELLQIVAYDNDGFLGDHIHIFGKMTDLGKWGNSISSLVMVAGCWEFLRRRTLRARRWPSWVRESI
jgi:hypothetical protein